MAPLHIRKKFVTVNLSKELKKKYGKRNLGIRKNDKVRIMNGEFRKKEGKVTNVLLKYNKITIEGIQRKKRDGSKVDVRIEPSNAQIIELDLNDKIRINMLKKENNAKIKEKQQVPAGLEDKK